MRIVFIGAVRFSMACLEELLAAGADVRGVVTLDLDRTSMHGDAADLAPIAEASGVPLHRVRHINDQESIGLIRSLRPDVILVLGWSQLLGDELLSIAPCVGSHPALLPRDRGRHPITWALVDGLEESGLTFLWLDRGADSGDILWQRRFPIRPDDDAADVYARIEALGREAMRELLPQLEAGSAPRIRQDEALATWRRKRTDDDRVLDWRLSTPRLYNLVRGLARPYVGAITRASGQDVVVWKARPLDDEAAPGPATAPPGSVVAVDGGTAVRTGSGWLRILETEPPDAVKPGLILELPA